MDPTTAGTAITLAHEHKYLISKLLGPACEEIGLTAGDVIRACRTQLLPKLLDKAFERIDRRGGQTVPIPPRLLLPILDLGTIEDNNTLRDKWAALLAAASDPNSRTLPFGPFIEILRQLTPEDALFLDFIFGGLGNRQSGTGPLPLSAEATNAAANRLAIALDPDYLAKVKAAEPFSTLAPLPAPMHCMRERVLLTIDNVSRLGLLSLQRDRLVFGADWIKAGDQLSVTRFGMQFIRCCSSSLVTQANDSGD